MTRASEYELEHQYARVNMEDASAPAKRPRFNSIDDPTSINIRDDQEIISDQETKYNEEESTSDQMTSGETEISEERPRKIKWNSDCMVFASNLPFQLDQDKDLLNAFSSHKGAVKNDLVPLAVRVTRDPVSRQCKGFGHLLFASKQQAMDAVSQLDHRVRIFKRPIYLALFRRREERDAAAFAVDRDPKTLFLNRLPEDCTVQDICQCLHIQCDQSTSESTDQPSTADVRLVFDRTGKFKRFAYVEFANEQTAQQILDRCQSSACCIREQEIGVQISNAQAARNKQISTSKLVPRVLQVSTNDNQSTKQLSNEDFCKLYLDS